MMAMVMLITRIVLCPPMKTLSRGASPFSSRGLQLFRLLVLLPAEVVWYAFLSQATSLCRDVSAAAESSALLQLHEVPSATAKCKSLICKYELPSSLSSRRLS